MIEEEIVLFEGKDGIHGSSMKMDEWWISEKIEILGGVILNLYVRDMKWESDSLMCEARIFILAPGCEALNLFLPKISQTL